MSYQVTHSYRIANRKIPKTAQQTELHMTLTDRHLILWEEVGHYDGTSIKIGNRQLKQQKNRPFF